VKGEEGDLQVRGRRRKKEGSLPPPKNKNSDLEELLGPAKERDYERNF